MRTIPVKKISKSSRFFRSFGRYIQLCAVVCSFLYGFGLFQMNVISSKTKKLESDIAVTHRNMTKLQTDIYKATKDKDFMHTLSQQSAIVYSQPRETAILYMKLPNSALVMR
jgi:hypothetical protein